MTERCTVLIASAERLPALTAHSREGGELLAFTDADALRAVDAIMSRHPAVVVLERTFASTARGAALIHRIKAAPSLAQTEIRVTSAERAVPASDASRDVPPQSPDRRRAPRITLGGSIDVLVDGLRASLVDVTAMGAQVVSTVPLKPKQRVRLVVTDTEGAVRCRAVVTWASLESGPRYRAGLEFVEANAPAIAAFCARRTSL